MFELSRLVVVVGGRCSPVPLGAGMTLRLYEAAH